MVELSKSFNMECELLDPDHRRLLEKGKGIGKGVGEGKGGG